jgi:viroplasmin and RNaseH domain-containing protein
VEDSNLWYAVVKRTKTSQRSIYSTWGEVSLHVTELSGANSKKFWSYQEAKMFTTSHKKSQEEVHQEQEESVASDQRDGGMGTSSRDQGETVWSRQIEIYFLPQDLIGMDPR